MKPDLQHILFLDIETVACAASYQEMPERLRMLWDKKAALLRADPELTSADLFGTQAGIYSEFGKIVVIGVGMLRPTGDQEMKLAVKGLANHDEKTLLLEFCEILEKADHHQKLVLCGHNGKEFDFPYLCRRMLVNGIPLPRILDVSGKKPWEVPFLDTMELWKFGDRKSYTSLDLLAAIFDIPSSKIGIDGSQVNEFYYKMNNLEAIRQYCMEDVAVTANLYVKMQYLPEPPFLTTDYHD